MFFFFFPSNCHLSFCFSQVHFVFCRGMIRRKRLVMEDYVQDMEDGVLDVDAVTKSGEPFGVAFCRLSWWGWEDKYWLRYWALKPSAEKFWTAFVASKNDWMDVQPDILSRIIHIPATVGRLGIYLQSCRRKCSAVFMGAARVGQARVCIPSACMDCCSCKLKFFFFFFFFHTFHSACNASSSQVVF
jgi:hypothetical protein